MIYKLYRLSESDATLAELVELVEVRGFRWLCEEIHLWLGDVSQKDATAAIIIPFR